VPAPAAVGADRAPEAGRPHGRRPGPGCPGSTGPAVAGHGVPHPLATDPGGARGTGRRPLGRAERAEDVDLTGQRYAVEGQLVGAPRLVQRTGPRADRPGLRADGRRLWQRRREVELADVR